MRIGVLGTGVVGQRNIIELGERSTARCAHLLPIRLSLQGARGLPPSSFQFRIAP
jgi:hypothetical protein